MFVKKPFKIQVAVGVFCFDRFYYEFYIFLIIQKK